jgi:DNA-3-methyladenine glycosylase II
MPRPAHERTSYYRLAALAPFRLDLTVSALRRLSTNIVDQLTPDGEYLRAFDGEHGPVLIRVRQHHSDALNITVRGDAGKDLQVPALMRRILGVDRDLRPFERAAARIGWLRPLAERMRGLKPPRYPTLWEACVNVVVFQQVSLKAASTIVRRLIERLGTEVETEVEAKVVRLYTFPGVERVLSADDSLLRGVGLSPRKLAALRRVGEALASGALDEARLEECPTPEAAGLLQQFKGIGPWSATVILLRGLGRLDLFPLNDTSVTSNLELVAGARSHGIARDLEALGPQRGMLYYYLLLARLDASGDLGRPSAPRHPPRPRAGHQRREPR